MFERAAPRSLAPAAAAFVRDPSGAAFTSIRPASDPPGETAVIVRFKWSLT